MHSGWRRTTRRAKFSISHLHALLCVFFACLEIRILAATLLHSHLHRTDAIGCLRCLKCKINFQYTVLPIASLAANAMFPERLSPDLVHRSPHYHSLQIGYRCIYPIVLSMQYIFVSTRLGHRVEVGFLKGLLQWRVHLTWIMSYWDQNCFGDMLSACQIVARSNVHGWLDPLSGGLGSDLMFLKNHVGWVLGQAAPRDASMLLGMRRRLQDAYIHDLEIIEFVLIIFTWKSSIKGIQLRGIVAWICIVNCLEMIGCHGFRCLRFNCDMEGSGRYCWYPMVFVCSLVTSGCAHSTIGSQDWHLSRRCWGRDVLWLMGMLRFEFG